MKDFFLQSDSNIQSSLNASFSTIVEQLTPEFPHTTFVTDLAIIMIIGAIVTLAFFKIRQPLIIGYLFAGMLIDAISIFYIFLPIFMPIMDRFGWDPIWFGIMMTFNLAIGQFTPPVAVNLYVTTHLAEIPVEETFKAVIPFIFAMAVGLLLLCLFPSITLFLPHLLGMSG